MLSEDKTRELLEIAYQNFHKSYMRHRDPVCYLWHYDDPRDQEIVGIFSAVLAYGNVNSILKSVGKVLQLLGPNPYRTIFDGNIPDCSAFYHRFTKGVDIEILAFWLRGAIRKSENLENYFVGSGGTTKELLSSFVERLTQEKLPGRLQKALPVRQQNLKYLISSPTLGSACKRLNLYLRWMVRKNDGIDLGIWKKISPAQLIMPVDTHILKTIHHLKWSKQKQANWKVAEACTEILRRFDPNDPVRFDFALCHISMQGKRVTEL